MKILSINCGSSSVKYKLFDIGENQQLLASGVADRIGQSGSRISHKPADQKEQIFEKSLPQHRVALQEIYDILRNDKSGVAPDLDKIEGIGHRVVHGGMEFTGSIIIDDHVIETIRENAKFAPLHNPINIAGIEICRRLLPDVPNVAVFDTALHQTMPAKAFLYGLPMEQYEKYGIRRYGFQGISHAYVAKEAARIMKKPLEALKIITCHLGNGASVTAFKEGKSIDTSMGLTPLEGLVMATRSGDIDPSIILYLIESVGMSPAQVANMLNKDSGLKGLCGKSDIRDVLEVAALGNQSAKIALEIFCYRIQKYIGAYVASMNGLDVIVFTGCFQGKLLISIRTSQEISGAGKVIKRIIAGKGSGGGHLTYAGGQIPLKKDTEAEYKGLKRLVERRFLKSIGVSADRCSRLLAESEGTVLH